MVFFGQGRQTEESKNLEIQTMSRKQTFINWGPVWEFLTRYSTNCLLSPASLTVPQLIAGNNSKLVCFAYSSRGVRRTLDEWEEKVELVDGRVTPNQWNSSTHPELQPEPNLAWTKQKHFETWWGGPKFALSEIELTTWTSGFFTVLRWAPNSIGRIWNKDLRTIEFS